MVVGEIVFLSGLCDAVSSEASHGMGVWTLEVAGPVADDADSD